jgi:hypothetical protein
MNERPSEFSSVPRSALPALREAVVDAYGPSELAEKALEFGVDFATVVPTGVPFGDQVLDLLRHFRNKNTLGRLLGALADGRPDFPEFRAKLVKAIKEAPAVDADDVVVDRTEGGGRSRRVPLAIAAAAAGLAAIAFGVAGYFAPELITNQLVIHLREAESSILSGVYVKYDSVAKGPEQLAERGSSGEFHIARDDITPRTGIYFEPDPAAAEGAQGPSRCEGDCYKILKVDYEYPNVLYLYLEEARQ